jgi:hypothetical protein
MFASGQTEKGETGEEQNQKHVKKFFLTSRGLFINNSCWQAKQLISHTAVTFYGDCVKMCDDFAPNFGDKTADCCIMTTHHLTLSFSPGNF